MVPTSRPGQPLSRFQSRAAAGAQQRRNLTTQGGAGGAHLIDTIQWNLKSKTDYKITDRVTPKTAVSLVITHFNYLRCEPTFGVEAKAVEGYADLEKLWAQVLAV